MVYVANSESNTVSVMDGIIDTVLPVSVPIGASPSCIAINANNDTSYGPVTAGHQMCIVAGPRIELLHLSIE